MATARIAHVLMETVEKGMDTISQPTGAGRTGVGGMDDAKSSKGSWAMARNTNNALNVSYWKRQGLLSLLEHF